jgi:spore maturation protein B
MSPNVLVWIDLFNNWFIMAIILAMVGIAWIRGVKVYEEFVKGAKEGFDIAVMIIPYLVAVLCALAVFRYGGALEKTQELVSPITKAIRMDPELVPLALVRPLSGGGARGVMFDIWENVETEDVKGPDTLAGLTASVMQGSTETTFYVLAVYCGVVAIRRTRYALPACLAADVVGILAAVFFSNLFFRHLFQ